MRWMEQCAYISASRLRGGHMLTAGMDSVVFANATRVGDVLYVTAQVRAPSLALPSEAGVRPPRRAQTLRP
jgi:acyl-CoA hydrolase